MRRVTQRHAISASTVRVVDPAELLFRLLFEFLLERPFAWLLHLAQRALLGPEDTRRLGRAARRAVDSVAPDFQSLIAIDAEMRVIVGCEDDG